MDVTNGFLKENLEKNILDVCQSYSSGIELFEDLVETTSQLLTLLNFWGLMAVINGFLKENLEKKHFRCLPVI